MRVLRKEKTCKDMLGWKDQNITADKSGNEAWRDESKDIGEIRETKR